MEHKPDWNTKQVVSQKIVVQLRGMNEDEQRKFIVKLLDYLEPTFVQALAFAYGIVPEQEPASREVSSNE